MAKEDHVVCRWLHLSDLHFLNRANDEFGRNLILYGSKGELQSSSAKNLDEGGLYWAVRNTPVNCIVISGDFLFQGKFEESTKERLKRFLQDVYQICSTAGSWGWTPGAPMERLFWCPGNHDLNRDALIVENDHPFYRKDLMQTISNEGRFRPDAHTSLFTEKTFKEIYAFMHELRGDASSEQDNYEANLFFVPDTADPSVCFIAINTALSAGQVRIEDVSDKIEQDFNAFFKYHHAQNIESALEAYQSYCKHLKIQRREEIDDMQRLCFISEEQAKFVQQELKKQNNYIAILVGHHPFEFFNKDARTCFRNFIYTNAVSLYLHGHTHVAHRETPSCATFPIEDDSNLSIPSIGVGGLFLNTYDSYNQLSFSIGSLLVDNNKNYSCEINLFIFTPKSYSNRQWMVLASPICVSCNIGGLLSDLSTHSSSIPSMSFKDSVTTEKIEAESISMETKIDNTHPEKRKRAEEPNILDSITKIKAYYDTLDRQSDIEDT